MDPTTASQRSGRLGVARNSTQPRLSDTSQGMGVVEARPGGHISL